MKTLAALLATAALATTASAQLTLLSNFSANQAGGFSAGEIVAFDKSTDRLFVTSSGSDPVADPNALNGVYRVNIFGLANPSAPSTIGVADFSMSFGTAADMLALSSVAVDPLGRFGVAALIPKANTTTLGKVGFFNLSTGLVIGTSDVGFHPDSVVFSSDGSRLVVVNEGEFVASSATNAPGSISIFDVSGINSGNLSTLPSVSVTTKDFSAANLATGVSIAALRNSNIAAVGTSGTFNSSVPIFNTAAPEAIEPEYATISGDKVYVSLQDNNAIAVYDLTTGQYTNVTSLGTISQLIDASDRDGAGGANAIRIDDTVKGLPMPDTIAAYEVAGKKYVVTANEGDARVDDRDISRFGDTGGNDSMNPLIDTDSPSNFPLTATGIRADGAQGRLNISRIDGDTDGDGKIDDPTMIGTRSFSIWEDTGAGLALVYDSGSFFEQYIRDNDALGFVDSRSDDKGPEPEGLTLGVIDGKTFAFIGMERNAGIFMFEITNPIAPSFVDYIRISDGANTPLRPEGFAFVSAADSPNGQNLLIVGYEGDGTVTSSERIVIFSVVPEPGTISLLLLGAACALARRRRRA